MNPTPDSPVEKPQNGIAGLKHWRSDIVAGLLVSLISLPFSLGIAVASGAPPIAGLISAIIAGLLLPFLGGTYVTISGPAAGLAPVLLSSMIILGHKDLDKGYPLLLAAICVVGVVQIFLCMFKAARLAAVFPAAVVEGMLAAIGLLIIAKQMPHLLGVKFEAHEFFEYVRETPRRFSERDPNVFGLGVACLAFVFAISMIKSKWMKLIPPPLVMVAVGTIASLFLHINSKLLINIPEHPFSHGIVTPNFAGLLADKTLWWSVVGIVLTLTMIDGVESLATASAIDKIDPYHRKSNPNRTLLAMGISNICSSVAGGLTIIPGGVKSTACIGAGGKTLWANFYNAIFLLGYLLIFRTYINMIPYTVLAAMLIFIGWKLCRPAVWRHVAHVGVEQLALFTTTVVVTLATDLLWGILVGVATKLLMTALFSAPGSLRIAGRPRSIGGLARASVGNLPDLFRNPVSRREVSEGQYHLYFSRPLVCFNSAKLSRELEQIPADAGSVYLHVTGNVTLIDHTSCDNLIHFVEEYGRNGRGTVEIEGLDQMRAHSKNVAAMRFGPPERTGAVADLTAMGLGAAESEARSAVAALGKAGLTHHEKTASASDTHPASRRV
jgi:carbonic anhydrase